jgi:hypothetical protein
MKHSDFQDLIHLAYTDGKFIPTDTSICNDLIEGEIISVKPIRTRDLPMHKCYFSLLNYIWKWMPAKFQEKVLNKYFYKWLQTLKKEYKILFSFADEDKIKSIIDTCIDLGISAENASIIATKYGKIDMIEYESISFGRMDEYKFRNYVKEQLPFINENLINKLFDEETANNIIEDVEKEFEKYFTKLFAVK